MDTSSAETGFPSWSRRRTRKAAEASSLSSRSSLTVPGLIGKGPMLARLKPFLAALIR